MEENSNSDVRHTTTIIESRDLPSSSSTTEHDEDTTIPVYRELVIQSSAPKWLQLFNRLLPEPVKSSLKPPTNKQQWKKFLYIHLPIVYWVITYSPKYLIGDFVAGLTIGVTHIPQGIGFALLAMVSPSFGLYSSFIPVLLYSVFGTSRHLSVGTFPVVALMTGQVVDMFTSSSSSSCYSDSFNMTNTSMLNISRSSCELTACESEQANVAITLALIVGIIMLLMSFLKLGVISLFLSDALISGYTAAAAFTIFVTQWAPILGLDRMEAAVGPGLWVTPRRVIKYLGLLFRGKVSVAAIVTSIICFVILIACELANRFLKKKVKKISIYIPGQLIVVILATIISYVSNISSLPVISDVGGILPGKCYKATVPDFSLINGEFVVEAFVIAVVSFVINIAQAKLLAQKNAYTIHPDQELFAYGIMNIGGSFFGSFPTAGALSRTLLQDLTGGKTQLVGIISSVLVMIVIFSIGFLFDPLPNAAIGVIVIMALKGLFLQVRDVRRYFYLNWPDMLVWLVVFLSTLIIGLDIGLGIGIFFSMFIIVVRTILPYSSSLGEAKVWIYSSSGSDSRQIKSATVNNVPGVFIYQFNAPLYFANCSVFRSRLFIECGVNPNQFHTQNNKGCFEHCYEKVRARNEQRGTSEPEFTGVYAPQRLQEEREMEEISVNPTDSTLDDSCNVAVKDSSKRELKEFSGSQEETAHYHTLIIDCGPIGFVDSMGVTMIEKIVKEFNSLHIQVLLAAPSTPICEALDRYGFFSRFSATCLFPSVASAVSFAKSGHVVPKLEGAKHVSKKLVGNMERILSKSKRFGIFDKCIPNNDQTYEDPGVFLESTV